MLAVEKDAECKEHSASHKIQNRHFDSLPWRLPLRGPAFGTKARERNRGRGFLVALKEKIIGGCKECIKLL
jgi:hypothetical protein